MYYYYNTKTRSLDCSVAAASAACRLQTDLSVVFLRYHTCTAILSITNKYPLPFCRHPPTTTTTTTCLALPPLLLPHPPSPLPVSRCHCSLHLVYRSVFSLNTALTSPLTIMFTFMYPVIQCNKLGQLFQVIFFASLPPPPLFFFFFLSLSLSLSHKFCLTPD